MHSHLRFVINNGPCETRAASSNVLIQVNLMGNEWNGVQLNSLNVFFFTRQISFTSHSCLFNSCLMSSSVFQHLLCFVDLGGYYSLLGMSSDIKGCSGWHLSTGTRVINQSLEKGTKIFVQPRLTASQTRTCFWISFQAFKTRLSQKNNTPCEQTLH